jgi:hypothetical protein
MIAINGIGQRISKIVDYLSPLGRFGAIEIFRLSIFRQILCSGGHVMGN